MPIPANTPETTSPATRILTRPKWQAAANEHRERAEALTATFREFRARGKKHAIDDFLFTYYSYRPALLHKWHPGIGLELADAPEYASQRWYTTSGTDADATVRVDVAALLASRHDLVTHIRTLSQAVLDRPAQFGCFGLHEWAMVYKQEEHRHPIPLRLGQAPTDAVVESHRIQCSHFDAFRFFTPAARPLNQLQPTRAQQCALDQAGCLHANMDLYKWAIKLGPLVPGALLLDAFELAREIRWLDMRASPYDVSDYGVAPVAIETPEGKAQYVRMQREFSQRAQAIRARLLEVITAAEAAVGQ
ncbi:3-methyladenine DNA glycosylase [Gulosibacter bifidus]|uniref:3-methyladenine DNA glycosylase n=1 Tax=Gulosibacter bifidus TaxID=272239 RepID=A0ABW5RGF9_9MICO|nr:3-methyladenine DNA glycosylase [Gulosibacter bifidus]